MIQMYHVYMSYGSDSPGLIDVSLRIEKAEFIFITGPSGAGKTSLLRVIMLAERSENGQVLLFGKNVANIREREITQFRRRMGMVFQDFKLLPSRTVEQNVAISLEVLGMGRREIRKKVGEALELVGLEHRAHKLPPTLSGGEQQRVAIARAIVNDPQILMADEPTGNLDQALSEEIGTLLNRINARGSTVLVATHDTAWIQRSQHRVIHLEKGRVVSGGMPMG